MADIPATTNMPVDTIGRSHTRTISIDVYVIACDGQYIKRMDSTVSIPCRVYAGVSTLVMLYRVCVS